MATFTPIDFLDGTKIAFGLVFCLGGIGTYLLALKVINHRGASLLAAVLFLYSPATIGDFYVRSTLAGLAGTSVLAFVLHAFASLWDRPTATWTGLAALALASLILTHNATAAMGMGMIVVFAASSYILTRDGRRFAVSTGALILGVGIASFFLIPSLAEVRFTHLAEISAGQIWGQFIDPLGNAVSQSFSKFYSISNWGPFDFHLAYPYGEPPFKLGLLDGLLLLSTGVVLMVGRTRPPAVVSLFVVSLLLYFGHSTWSQWFWEVAPAVDLLQFPWRLTRPLAPVLAVTGAWTLLQIFRSRYPLAIPLVALAAILNSMWLAPTEMKSTHWSVPVTPDGLLRWEAQEPGEAGTDDRLLPDSVQWEGFGTNKLPLRFGTTFPDDQWVDWTVFQPRGGKMWVLATRRGQQWIEARVEAGEATTVTFRSFYFPGWTAYVDGIQVAVRPSPRQEYEEGRWAALGLCQVDVPEGTHQVRLVFQDTPVRQWATAVSLLSAFCVLALLAGIGIGGRPINLKRRLVTATLVMATFGSLGWLISQGVSAYSKPDWIANRVVRDLATEAAEGRLLLTVPPGGKPEDYIRLKKLELQGEVRSAIYMHPTSSATSWLWVPKGAALEFEFGIVFVNPEWPSLITGNGPPW